MSPAAATSRSTSKPRRRTQAERRAATRALLLDATIDCLIDYGYNGVTTTRVVDRAGVSRGAQVHHFPTKAILVSEAMVHLADRRSADLERQADKLPRGKNRPAAALDLLWASHRGPLFEAAMELWVAARTDDELRERLVPVELQLARRTWELCRVLFGDFAKAKTFPASVEVALASMQGLAVLALPMRDDGGALTGEGQTLDQLWRACRKRLLVLFEEPAPAKGARG